jgi:hypothetical protein
MAEQLAASQEGFSYVQLADLVNHQVYRQMLALTSPTSGGRSVGIVRSRTQVTEFWSQCGRLTCIWVLKRSSFHYVRHYKPTVKLVSFLNTDKYRYTCTRISIVLNVCY